MDMDSLYTNTDIDEGVQAVGSIFLKHPDTHRPDKELLQLLEINLRRNDYEFDGEFYLQTKGTAMGQRLEPSNANVFIAEWKNSALAACRRKPLHYLRYLEYIWGIWTHSKEDFDEFLNTDMDIKVYFKETDTHSLLHKSSFHPKHTYAGLLKSQLIRFHRICTNKQDFMSATKTLFKALANRGYSRSFRRSALKTFLQPKINIVYCVYHPLCHHFFPPVDETHQSSPEKLPPLPGTAFLLPGPQADRSVPEKQEPAGPNPNP